MMRTIQRAGVADRETLMENAKDDEKNVSFGLVAILGRPNAGSPHL